MFSKRRGGKYYVDTLRLEIERMLGIDVQYESLYKLNARSRPLLFVPEPCPVGPATFGILSVQISKTRRVNGHNLTSRKVYLPPKQPEVFPNFLNRISFRGPA